MSRMILKTGINLGIFSKGARRCTVGDELRNTVLCTSSVSDRSSSRCRNHHGTLPLRQNDVFRRCIESVSMQVNQ